jgi:hypothetical protein
MNGVTGQRLPFKKTDKGPMGTYVVYDQLQDVFANAKISINHTSPSSLFKYVFEQGQAYFIVSPMVDLMDGEIDAIKRFVNNGNVLFISTYFLDKDLEEWMGVKIERNFSDKDSISVYDTDKEEYIRFYLGSMLNGYIAKYDSAAPGMKVLGKFGGKVNCISFKIGSGYVVLQTQPFMFSNYHLIKKKTKAYPEILFSSLPGPLETIYWDEYTKGSNNGEMAPLKFVMSQPPLKNAFLWSLAALVLLVLFAFNRMQRVLKLSEPLVNSSLDMVKTVSDMYYFGRRNEVMAKKKIAHWLEFLRTKYNIFTSLQPDMFWNAVEMRSGMQKEKVAELKVMVELYRNGDVRISDFDLIKLNNLVDSFYKS